ncbi:hypothetical protein [uncultured Ruminococcus sp.]|uniref:hypothetical protein n=1 Tax=uncultured Ruminococcus sp. TaxID=165186 RepID=UPI0025FCA22D|nr:hypothetical protein [uncultured Ruminococcus sp.]
MLKHEEMIENVHRRIAQYEEEKKMKHSTFKNIISAIKPNTKKEETKTSEDGYIEVVSGTERIETSHRMLRMVSTLAAGAVLVTGIGATGLLLNKNKPQKSSETDNSTISTEAEEITQITNEKNSKVSPFGDMGKANLSLSILHEEISFDDYEDYSSATYDRLAKFMNSLDWGEGTDVEPIDIPDFYKYEGEGYIINWNKADINYSVVVLDNETVYYIVQKCQPNNGYFDYNYIESHIYKIDYAAFDAGVKDILSQNVSDKGEYLSQRDLMKYFDGEFLYAELYLEKTGNSEIVKPEKESTRKALEGFLENDFMHMLKKGDSADNENSEADYTIVRYYKTGDDTERRETYFITNNGSVSLCAYVIANGDSIPQFPVNFSIDVKEFDAALNDVLSGKNDAKYADKPKHESENKNNTEKHEDVQPTTEKQEQQTTAAPDERQEQQIPENTEPATAPEETDEPEDSRDVFLSAKPGVYIWDKNGKLIATPKTHDFETLNAFSKDKLDPILDMSIPVPTDIDLQGNMPEYDILRKYIDTDGKLKYSNYYIYGYGHMMIYYYEFERGEWWPYGYDGCGIDYAEVKAMLDEVLESSKLQKE